MTTWLHDQRLEAAREVVCNSNARTVVDLGCGDGDLLTRLMTEPQIERIIGMDLCRNALGRLRRRLDRLDGGGTTQIDLIHGSMTEAGTALAGFDCAILIETIEHIDPERLSALERAVFARMRPVTVVITTPNVEFNPLLGVPVHRFRHPDHRFEWDRAKFQRWAKGVADRNSYRVVCRDIAGGHPVHGGASQMAVFAAARPVLAIRSPPDPISQVTKSRMNLTESEEHACLEVCLKDILGNLQSISTRLRPCEGNSRDQDMWAQLGEEQVSEIGMETLAEKGTAHGEEAENRYGAYHATHRRAA